MCPCRCVKGQRKVSSLTGFCPLLSRTRTKYIIQTDSEKCRSALNRIKPYGATVYLFPKVILGKAARAFCVARRANVSGSVPRSAAAHSRTCVMSLTWVRVSDAWRRQTPGISGASVSSTKSVSESSVKIRRIRLLPVYVKAPPNPSFIPRSTRRLACSIEPLKA